MSPGKASGSEEGGATRSESSSGAVAASGTIAASGSGSTGDSGAAGKASGDASGSATSTSGGAAGTSGSVTSSSSGSASGAADASTGGSDAGGSCTKDNAACVASNTGCNVASYYLYDNQWNCGASSGNHCGPESAYGCANSDNTVSFVVTSNQPAGNTAVLSYPAMQDNFDSKPLLSSFKTISATFEETSPHVGDYEVAWDCWFNGNANEFMIWVDNYNQVPGGKKVASNVVLGGHAYDVWWASSSGYLAFNANPTFAAGTVDLLLLFNYAVTNGWLPAGSTVDQLSFGVEICSTNGQDATWTVSGYSMAAN
jgi:hypothetical protein